MAIAYGHVKGITPPKSENGPFKVFIGGVELTVWKTIKDEDDDGNEVRKPNPLLEELQAAGDTPKKAKYADKDRQYNGKTYTDHNLIDVADADTDDDEVVEKIKKGDAATDAAMAQKSQNSQKGGRAPYDDSGTASRWAMSMAHERLGSDATHAALIKEAKALLTGADDVRKHQRTLEGKFSAAAGGKSDSKSSESSDKTATE